MPAVQQYKHARHAAPLSNVGQLSRTAALAATHPSATSMRCTRCSDCRGAAVMPVGQSEQGLQRLRPGQARQALLGPTASSFNSLGQDLK